MTFRSDHIDRLDSLTLLQRLKLFYLEDILVKKVLVYGWYGQHNLGDEAFKLSFKELWPNIHFTFVGSIPANVNEIYDSLWVGGGSFLEQKIQKLDQVTIPISFIGVGSAKSPSDSVRAAMERSDLIVFRDNTAAHLWPKSHTLPDLVFARRDLKPLPIVKKKQIAVFLNDFVSPLGSKVADWKSEAYHRFIKEFALILDDLSFTYEIKLFPMCINPRVDDRKIASAIIARSDYPQRYDWILEEQSELALRTIIQESEFVIAQRFHGLVYSILCQTPCLTISSHDKFSSLCSQLDLPFVNFYKLTKKDFMESLKEMNKITSPKVRQYRRSAIDSWRKIANLKGSAMTSELSG